MTDAQTPIETVPTDPIAEAPPLPTGSNPSDVTPPVDPPPVDPPSVGNPPVDLPPVDPPPVDPPPVDPPPVGPPTVEPPVDPPVVKKPKIWVQHKDGGEKIQVDADAQTVELPIADFVQVSAPVDVRVDVTTDMVGIVQDGKALAFQAALDAPFGTLPDGQWWVWVNGFIGLQRRKSELLSR